MKTSYIISLLCFLSAIYSNTLAQIQKEEIRFDPEKGYYVIQYWSETDSTFQSATYIPGDIVKPVVTASVERNLDDNIFIYNYKVYNEESALESLYAFEITSNANIQKLKSPNSYWRAYYLNRKSVSRWAHTGGQIKGIIPGDSADGFKFTAGDIPGIVNGFASSNTWLGFPDEGPTGAIRQRLDSLQKATQHVEFKTVGPKELPANISNTTLLDTLQSYLAFSCDTTWIANQGVCRSLEAKLDNVERQLQRGNTQPAAGSLLALLNELNALREEQMSSEAYALLYYNGQFLLEKLRE